MSVQIPVKSYKDVRNEIKTGDLLAWGKSPGLAPVSDFLLWIVKVFTKSKYGHVGIAIRLGGRLMVVEAVIPRVTLTPISAREEFYWIPMSSSWSNAYLSKLFVNLGKPYSILDCIRAYLGKTDISNDRWQCAELVSNFYEHIGEFDSLPDTPVEVVNKMVENNNGHIAFVKPL